MKVIVERRRERVTDADVADQVERSMRCDYWWRWSRTSLAKHVGRCPKRLLRVLRSDKRFRDVRDDHGNYKWCLWR